MEWEEQIKQLNKKNQILQKKLDRSEAERVQLESNNEKNEFILKKIIDDLQETRNDLECKQNELETAFRDLQIMQDKTAILGGLVSGVAHEINNPIGFLAGNLNPAQHYIDRLFNLLDLYQHHFPEPGDQIDELIEDIDLDFLREDLPKLLNSMHMGIKRIQEISGSLRRFSRADQDYPVETDLHQGLDNTLLILKHRLKANAYRAEIEVIKQYGEMPLVECHVGQINQVFMNLLANAIDTLDEKSIQQKSQHLQPSPSKITIVTQYDAHHEKICVRIKDDGMGMSEEIQQKVFDYLFTTKPIGKGTGLGLSIAHQIIAEKHQGELLVDSIVGEGTEFIINLPVKKLC